MSDRGTSLDAQPPRSDESVVDVDATGLSCPLPVIELAKAVEHVAVGGLVRLVATDPAARVDVPVWCRMKRHTLREATQDDGGRLRFLVQRAH